MFYPAPFMPFGNELLDPGNRFPDADSGKRRVGRKLKRGEINAFDPYNQMSKTFPYGPYGEYSNNIAAPYMGASNMIGSYAVANALLDKEGVADILDPLMKMAFVQTLFQPPYVTRDSDYAANYGYGPYYDEDDESIVLPGEGRRATKTAAKPKPKSKKTKSSKKSKK
jgi:hypothetical protein